MFQKFVSQFKNVLFLWALCFLVNIITFLFIYIKIKPQNKTVALFYNIIAGVEWYGKGRNLYLIPLAGLIILIVNLLLFRFLKTTKAVLPFLTVFVSLFVQIILLMAALSLSTVN